MKRLYLLRHAEAAGAHGGADKDRVLTAHGRAQARAIGRMMIAHGYIPSFVYCSAAVRTRQTFAGLAEHSGDLPVSFENQIYDAHIDDLLRLIREADDTHESLLLIAHNPSIYELALKLSKGEEERLAYGYKPATLSVLECPAARWAEIGPDQNTLMDLFLADDHLGDKA